MQDAQPSPLTEYLSQIDQHSLLSPEQERELALSWRNCGDAAAAKKLVLSNLRFVVKIALEYRPYGMRLLDLIQEGNLGCWSRSIASSPTATCA